MPPTSNPTAQTADGLTLFDRHLAVQVGQEIVHCHYVWLRDNCWCAECRVAQTQERRAFTPDIPANIAPASAVLDADGALCIDWNDDHASAYTAAWLRTHDYSEGARASRRHDPELWDATFEVPIFEHDALVESDLVQIAYFEAIRQYGAALVRNTRLSQGKWSASRRRSAMSAKPLSSASTTCDTTPPATAWRTRHRS